jgi:hypothetical protein
MSFLDITGELKMRLAAFLLVFIFGGSFTSARADVIFNGTVSLANGGSGFPPCGQQGVGVGLLSLSCGGLDGIYSSTVSGNGDPFSGRVLGALTTTGADNPYTPQIARENISAVLSQVYVLTGGTGSAVVNFSFYVSPWPRPANQAPDDVTCSLSFDGVEQQACTDVNFFGWDYSETVEYNVPFSILFQMNLGGIAEEGDGYDAGLNYSFDAPGLQVETPEPSSISLVISGLLGIIACAKRRSKSRQNVWLRAVGIVPGQGLAKRLSFRLELVEQSEICRTQGSV